MTTNTMCGHEARRVMVVADALPSVAGTRVVCTTNLPLAKDEAEANARLIAVAPEMFEALKWSLRVWFEILHRESEPWTDAALAVIAKAEGR